MEGTNGICIECSEVIYGGVEPDAEGYECDCCGNNSVVGMEIAIIMGLIDVEG